MADWHDDHGFDSAATARVKYAYAPYLLAQQSKTLVPFSATDPNSRDNTAQKLQGQIANLGFDDVIPSHPAAHEHMNLFFNDGLPPQIPQEIDTVVFADILSRHLSRYARKQMLMEVIPTDEMFKRESRRVLYQDGDDELNQTVADDPKRFETFRSKTGTRRQINFSYVT